MKFITCYRHPSQMTYYAIVHVNLVAGIIKLMTIRKNHFDKIVPWNHSRIFNCHSSRVGIPSWRIPSIIFHERIILSPLVHDVDIPSSKVCPSFVRRQFFILGRNCKFRGYLLRDTVFFSALWDLSREISLKGEKSHQ